MGSEPYKWCCRNMECKRQNLVDSGQLEQDKKDRSHVYLICGTCGMVHIWSGSISSDGKDWLRCLPFSGTEMKFPKGKIPANTPEMERYIDYQGFALGREDFIVKYGIDPEIYLNWQAQGKPKYKNRCE